MKKTSIVLCASLLAAFAIITPVLAKDPPASAEQLRSELESALKAKDTNALLALVNWEGVSDKMKSLQIMSMGGLLNEDVQSVTLSPLPADSKFTYEKNDVRYSPNVSVVGFVEIKFAQNKFNHAAKIPYGKTGKFFYLPGTKEEKVAALATKEKSFDEAASAEQLRSELESAFKASDTNAVLSLINWEGVSEQMKSFESKNMIKAIQHGIVAARLVPLAADFPLARERNGMRFSPNIAAVGLIEIEFAKKDTAETTPKITRKMPYGKKGEAFYIAGTIEEKVATPATNEKSLSIMVVGSNLTKAETFTGAYIYVKDGQQIKETLSSNGSAMFSGDYIKSCRVQLTSGGNGPFQLVITEAGKKIFESKKNTTKEPVIYEDAIDQLVVKLSASHGLWVNGMSPTLGLPASASTDQVLEKVFVMTGFDHGHVTSHQVVTTRKVEIAGGPSGLYTATLLDTNLGRKIVLLRHEGETAGWWSRVYDPTSEPPH